MKENLVILDTRRMITIIDQIQIKRTSIINIWINMATRFQMVVIPPTFIHLNGYGGNKFIRKKFMHIDKSTISKYTAYFHDGSLIAIDYGKDDTELTLTMESAEVDPEDIKDPIHLSEEERIKGKLHLKGIKNIYIDDEKLSTPLKMNYDDGSIFDLEIKDN